MLALADRLGASALVTGHYARDRATTARARCWSRAADPHKDQTYMLAGARPRAARRVRFPLGEPDQAARCASIARAGRPAGRREAREPGPLLPGGHEPRALPRAPRRRRATRPGEVVDRARPRARPPPRPPPLHGRPAQGPRRRGGRAAVRAGHRRRPRTAWWSARARELATHTVRAHRRGAAPRRRAGRPRQAALPLRAGALPRRRRSGDRVAARRSAASRPPGSRRARPPASWTATACVGHGTIAA